MNANTRLTVSGIVAAILFGAGYAAAFVIPGGGGGDSASNFQNFYASDGQMDRALALGITMMVGCLAVLWFFNELRARLPDDILTRVAYSIGVIGIIAVPLGLAILAGPTASVRADGMQPVAVSVADTFAQAGYTMMLLVGMGSFAIAALLMSIAAIRAHLYARWMGIVGCVLGVLTFGSVMLAPGYFFVIWLAATGIAVGLSSAKPAARMRTAVPAPPVAVS